MSSISTTGGGCGQLLPGPRGSPMPQADEPSVRFPMYMKCRKMVAAAFIPRPNSGSCPTTAKFFDVPGVPPPGPTVTPSGCALPPPRALTAPAAGIASRLTEAAMHTRAGRNFMIVTSPGRGLHSPHTVDPHNPTGKGTRPHGPWPLMPTVMGERSLQHQHRRLPLVAGTVPATPLMYSVSLAPGHTRWRYPDPGRDDQR